MKHNVDILCSYCAWPAPRPKTHQYLAIAIGCASSLYRLNIIKCLQTQCTCGRLSSKLPLHFICGRLSQLKCIILYYIYIQYIDSIALYMRKCKTNFFTLMHIYSSFIFLLTICNAEQDATEQQSEPTSTDTHTHACAQWPVTPSVQNNRLSQPN